MGAVVYVDPTAGVGGKGTIASPYNSWSQVSFAAGNVYLQKAGTVYQGSVQVTIAATKSAPIVLSAYGTGAAPIIQGSVNLDGASFVRVAGFTIKGAATAGVILQNGASNNEIGNNAISGSGMGIWIGNGAGGSNSIHNNVISGNSSFGIAVSQIANAVGSETTISNNLIIGNGSHGIELNGNDFIVSRNVVSDNGLLDSGASGIHAYASGSNDGYGNDNTISENIVVGTQDTKGNDGNGIEADQWTHDNTISGNFVYGNDGAGVAIYNSRDNTVKSNFIGGNELDPDDTHTRRGEILLNETANLTTGNMLSGNTVLAAFQRSAAVYGDAAVASTQNSFSGNVLENLASGNIYDWGFSSGSSLTYWDSISSGDKFSGVATFVGSSGASYDFAFAGMPTLMLDGRNVRLLGWTESGGLGLTYL